MVIWKKIEINWSDSQSPLFLVLLQERKGMEKKRRWRKLNNITEG
jgi:hypothetical protein